MKHFFSFIVCLLALKISSLEAGAMKIALVFSDDNFSPVQKSVFYQAASRWERVIQGSDKLGFDYHVEISASCKHIDTTGGVLGYAGPTHLWSESNLPMKGIMCFDRHDLDEMERNGTLNNVITHEMAHVLGFGTTWQHLVLQLGTHNPIFNGENAKKVYGVLRNAPRPLAVPVANTGGSGTYGGHWREAIFGDELMTGFLNSSTDRISSLTLAAFEDLGYQVRYDNAEAYWLPTPERLLELSQEPSAYQFKEVMMPVKFEDMERIAENLVE